MLKVKNISTGYHKKQVLFSVSLEVAKGEIVLLAGSNGSGKSTLLKSIFGLLPLWNKGQIVFDGENITDTSTAALLKKGLLYIPQKSNLYNDLTVKENLEMAGLTLSRNLFKQRMEHTLSIFSTLRIQLYRTPMKLSGGERQLLTLAMANLHQPRMLLLDEPYSALSPKNLSSITENLKLLKDKIGVTLMIVEHRVKECLVIADRVIGLKLGRVFIESEVNKDFHINQLNEVFV